MLRKLQLKGPKKRVRNKKQIKKRNNKQKYFYSGKKKRHTIKSQIVVQSSRKIICTNFSNGKKHDFKLFKESHVRWIKKIKGITDSGYTGIDKIQSNTKFPKKRTKKKPLTKEEKKENKKLASERVLNENIIGFIKRFKILSDRYRNRRKRFGLRFNLISGICNKELVS
jgi:hypothetical protein